MNDMTPPRATLSLATPAKSPKPKRKPGGKHEPAAGTVVRGARVRLYPKRDQAIVLDRWRNLTRQLWNLLLGMEMAAYSGERYRPDSGWRKIWAEVAGINHDLALTRRAQRVADGKEGGPEPVPPPIDKILARNLPEPPHLFIWENDLQKVMARLKQVPQTAWIGEIPSHAAQRVVKELVTAIKTMLKERGKRAAGTGGRDTGFPKFKAAHYASGSVYFANTQLTIDFKRRRLRFPGGIGWVRYDAGMSPVLRDGHKLMGARAWRQGEDWWLSPQFEIPAPAAGPQTDREVGVKVSTRNVTLYDGGRFEELPMPEDDARAQRRQKLWGRRLSRRREAQKARGERIAARKQRQGKPPRRVRLRRSKGFFEASAQLAKRQAHEGNRRNDRLHKISRRIVDTADHITTERLDVAGMMVRDDGPHKAPAPVRRRAMRRAAMARFLTLVKYKAADAARTLTETHELFPRVQACAACGTVNEAMRDGRAQTRCEGCGAPIHRQLNAAENQYESGAASRRSGLEAE